MSREIVHSILIIVTICVSFLISTSALNEYLLQINAVFILAFLIYKKTLGKSGNSHLLESTVFSFVVTTLINTTGNLESPFFFLIHFLLFSLSLFLEPIVSITTALSYILFFLLTFPAGESSLKLIPIFSLAFLPPFALFLGQEFLRERHERKKNEDLKTNTFLFLSLVLKNHVKNIIDATDNYQGDHHLQDIKKNADRMKKLIDEYERQL